MTPDGIRVDTGPNAVSKTANLVSRIAAVCFF